MAITKVPFRIGRLVLFMLLPALPAYSQTEFSKTIKFSAVRLSYADLSDLVLAVHKFLGDSYTSPPKGYRDEYLTVGDGSASLRLAADFSTAAFRTAPPAAYSAHYLYESPEAAVSEVELDLADYDQELTVSGRSREQVEGLSLMLSEEVSKWEVEVGGLGFRYTWGAVLLMIGLSLLGVASPPQIIRIPLTIRLDLALIIGMLINVSVWLFPWEKLLPGAAIYAGDASWLVRHQPAVTFTGVVLTLVMPIGIWYIRRLAARMGASSVPGGPQPSAGTGKGAGHE